MFASMRFLALLQPQSSSGLEASAKHDQPLSVLPSILCSGATALANIFCFQVAILQHPAYSGFSYASSIKMTLDSDLHFVRALKGLSAVFHRVALGDDDG